jgi:hypothetical protein
MSYAYDDLYVKQTEGYDTFIVLKKWYILLIFNVNNETVNAVVRC